MMNQRDQLKHLLDSIPDEDDTKPVKRQIWDVFKSMKRPPDPITKIEKVVDEEEIRRLRQQVSQLQEKVRWLQSENNGLLDELTKPPAPMRPLISEFQKEWERLIRRLPEIDDMTEDFLNFVFHQFFACMVHTTLFKRGIDSACEIRQFMKDNINEVAMAYDKELSKRIERTFQ